MRSLVLFHFLCLFVARHGCYCSSWMYIASESTLMHLCLLCVWTRHRYGKLGLIFIEYCQGGRFHANFNEMQTMWRGALFQSQPYMHRTILLSKFARLGEVGTFSKRPRPKALSPSCHVPKHFMMQRTHLMIIQRKVNIRDHLKRIPRANNTFKGEQKHPRRSYNTIWNL